MESSSVFLLLGVSLLLSGPTVSAVSLTVSPDVQQFFSRKAEKVSLSCAEDGQTADGMKVKRTVEGKTQQCGNRREDFGFINDSFCIVSDLSRSDSGLYWCESSDRSSEQINITVTDGALILEVPALPVLTGSDVTLRCRLRSGLNTESADFLKNNIKIRSEPDGEFIIRGVQQSDEGFYSCDFDQAESARSRLRVKAPPPSSPPPSSSSSPPPSASPSPSSSSVSGSSLPIVPLVAALVSLLLVVLLLVAVLLLRRKQTGRKHEPDSDKSHLHETTYADVSIAQAANRREKHPADLETIYSGVKTQTAGLDDVTYGQVVIRGQGSAGVRPAQPSEPDMVYSSVRAGK